MNNDLISRSELKSVLENECFWCANKSEPCDKPCWHCINEKIDNAPTVELTEEQAIDKLHETGWLIRHDKEMTERPQGECRTCRHRDPEDKKCDCGGLERQGCLFPVSDDYYCKYYEKGGAE